MRKTLWIISLCLMCFGSGAVFGILIKPNLPPLVVVNEEIHLKIPKSLQDVKNQILHIGAQKSMLEEYLKWEERKGVIKK